MRIVPKCRAWRQRVYPAPTGKMCLDGCAIESIRHPSVASRVAYGVVTDGLQTYYSEAEVATAVVEAGGLAIGADDTVPFIRVAGALLEEGDLYEKITLLVNGVTNFWLQDNVESSFTSLVTGAVARAAAEERRVTSAVALNRLGELEMVIEERVGAFIREILRVRTPLRGNQNYRGVMASSKEANTQLLLKCSWSIESELAPITGNPQNARFQ
ncbi:hypothetical protein C8J57DRAFT_1211321 [Mycena rebaudengoi]|nr:hypothetical protein C8J57DRAFT_1211321 [Mycena rebaudengoi]